MNDLVPVKEVVAVKTRKFRPCPYTVETTVCFLLSAVLVAILSKPLAREGMMGWWWGFFIFCNVCYLAYGMKVGWAKGDPANGLVIATGPIAFYFWTLAGAWRTYYVYRKDGPGWTVKRLEKELMKTDLVQGTDFSFVVEHKRSVRRYLSMNGLCVEGILYEPYKEDDGKFWDCLSITDTKVNMVAREAER